MFYLAELGCRLRDTTWVDQASYVIGICSECRVGTYAYNILIRMHEYSRWVLCSNWQITVKIGFWNEAVLAYSLRNR